MSDEFYDEVFRHLTEPHGFLIFGPGEAELELTERLGRSKAPAERTIDVETTDKLADAPFYPRQMESRVFTPGARFR